MSRPYIPTDEERGEAHRLKLGIPSIEAARETDHPFMGSHVRGECFVCWLPQPSPQHGPIHLVGRATFACDPSRMDAVTAPMSQRTLRPEFASCPACLVVVAAAEVVNAAVEREGPA